jgi:hypothetical protein
VRQQEGSWFLQDMAQQNLRFQARFSMRQIERLNQPGLFSSHSLAKGERQLTLPFFTQ